MERSDMTRAGDVLFRLPEEKSEPKYTPDPTAQIKPPSREFCKGQIKRLAGLPFGPREPEAVTVLIDALTQHSESEGHARGIVDAFLQDESIEQCPTAAQIKHQAFSSAATVVRPDRNCAACSGTGYRIVEKGRVSGADRCGCWARRAR
jgi:hypothetical protein